MKKYLSKYDYLLLFIVILGFFFVIQQVIFAQKQPVMNDKIRITVVSTPNKVVFDNANITDIKSLYFDQQRETTPVINTQKTSDSYIFTLEGFGKFEPERHVFAGESVNVGQLVKLSGGYTGDAYITDIEKVE